MHPVGFSAVASKFWAMRFNRMVAIAFLGGFLCLPSPTLAAPTPTSGSSNCNHIPPMRSVDGLSGLGLCDGGNSVESSEPKSKSRNVLQVASTPFEILLEFASADEVLDYLVPRYPKVSFRPRPTMNGFYASGSFEDLLSIKRDVVWIDQPAYLSPLPATHVLQHISAEEALVALRHWVPQADFITEGNAVVHQNPNQSKAAVLVALGRLDRPSIRLRISREELSQAPPSHCQVPERRDRFECPLGDCGGVLHLTGLKRGDQIDSEPHKHPCAPFWVVHRDGQSVNIFVEFY